MNQTTSKCGAWCYYYFNGQCTKLDGCVSNYNERPDENNNININYNPGSGVNATELGVLSHSSGLIIGKASNTPKTIHINNCDCIYLTKRGIEVQFDLTSLNFNDISEITINGVTFKKE